MNTIEKEIYDFSYHLLKCEKWIEENSTKIKNQEESIISIIKNIGDNLCYKNSDKDSNAIKDIINLSINSFKKSQEKWLRHIQISSQVRQKLEDAGKGLILVVFGQTNAGKSTLGNFFRGETLKKALFDNEWKHPDRFLISKIKVIESATGTKEAEKDLFEEGSSETTQECQLFSMPGLLWVDTPGFGSVSEKLGLLAEKYARRADMVIYLDNSDAPGKCSVTEKLAKLLDCGRETLVVISRSDKDGGFLRDESGKVIKDEKTGARISVRIPKANQDRKAQEEQVLSALKKEGIIKRSGGLSAMSLSVLLAKKGIQENNSETFDQSCMPELLNRIKNLISDKKSFLELKHSDAKNNCIQLIDIIQGNQKYIDNTSGLHQIVNSLVNFEKKLNDKINIFNIDNIAERVVISTMNKISNKIQKTVIDAENIGRTTYIDTSNLCISACNIALDQINTQTKDILSDFCKETDNLRNQIFPKLESIALERQIEEHKYTISETERFERDPSGFIENVLGFFGKKYYASRIVQREKTFKIDLGFNSMDVIANLTACVEEAVRNIAIQSLKDVRESSLVHAQGRIKAMRRLFEENISRLDKLRNQISSGD